MAFCSKPKRHHPEGVDIIVSQSNPHARKTTNPLPMSTLAVISLGDLVTIAQVGELMRNETSKWSRLYRLYFDDDHPFGLRFSGGSGFCRPTTKGHVIIIFKTSISRTVAERRGGLPSGWSNRPIEHRVSPHAHTTPEPARPTGAALLSRFGSDT